MRSLVGTLINKTPIPYVSSRSGHNGAFAQASVRANTESLLNAMGSVGTLFAIVDADSTAVSEACWKLFRKTKDGRRRYGDNMERRTEVTKHAALSVWNRPNKFMTQQEFVQIISQHLDLVGEGWIVPLFAKSKKLGPLELWPVRPDKMAPVPSATDYLSGYVYSSPDGTKVPFGPDEVLFLRNPNPTDAYRGMGPVQSILTNLDSNKYSAEWNRNFFLNSAEPGGIIEVPESLSDGEFRELRDRWNEQHRGVANAHRVAILEHGKWVDRKFTQRDMQFAELSNISRDTIREAFRFPKPMLGSVDDVNRANAEAGEYVFARWLVKPRLERIKQMLNTEFLPLFGDTGMDLEFDYDTPVPPDKEADNAERESRANTYKTLTDAGVEPEDAAMIAGLPEGLRYNKPKPPPTQQLPAAPEPGKEDA